MKRSSKHAETRSTGHGRKGARRRREAHVRTKDTDTEKEEPSSRCLALLGAVFIWRRKCCLRGDLYTVHTEAHSLPFFLLYMCVCMCVCVYLLSLTDAVLWVLPHESTHVQEGGEGGQYTRKDERTTEEAERDACLRPTRGTLLLAFPLCSSASPAQRLAFRTVASSCFQRCSTQE